MKIEDKNKFIKDAEMFFNNLYKTALKKNCGEIELATFKPNKPTKQYFSDVKQAAEYAYNICNQGLDVYTGVNPRVGRKSNKENIHYLSAFHADVDFGDDGHNKKSELKDSKEAIKGITDFCIKPTYILFSGGGFHCFWALKTPVKVSDIGIDELESINLNLIKSLKGDIGTQNINRHLRIPGTYNFKPDYDTPPSVKTVHSNGPLYDFADFEQFINVKKTKNKKSDESQRPSNVSVTLDTNVKKIPVSDKIRKLIMHGNMGLYASISEADMAVVVALIHQGYEYSQISQIFKRFAIGDKSRDQQSPGKYLAHTIKKAKKYS
ncbi:MAG: RepB family DNA primase, partial [Desulfobacula sp.]|nr:RepB family DNA primase [Desulfobacula sp.]